MYTEVFENYACQGWTSETKLELLLQFLDRNADTVVTPEMFNDFLGEVQEIENASFHDD